MTQWEKYIEYLKQWAEEHSGSEFTGMSPVCFDEWEENENTEEQEVLYAKLVLYKYCNKSQ